MVSAGNVLPLKQSPLRRRTPLNAANPTLVLLSCVTIVVLYQNPRRNVSPHATLAVPSAFRAHEEARAFAEPRAYANYPWGRVCSAAARHRFLERFDVPHRALGQHHRPPTYAEARGRVLLSHIPREVGDGLGHRMCILNFELHLAMELGVAYSHRVSSYGSLTTRNALAVENLFGWGYDEWPRDHVMEEACARTQVINDTCEIPAESRICTALNSATSRFKKAVYVPHALLECYLDRSYGKELIDQRCYALVRRFVSAFPEANTLFITRPRLCFRDYLYTNFSRTGAWFHDKYWAAHHHDGASLHTQPLILPEMQPSNGTSDDDDDGQPADPPPPVVADVQPPQTDDANGIDAASRLAAGEEKPPRRALTLDPQRVHIALHVRRGDFFNYTTRVLIADDTYADMAARIVVALHEMADANVPVTVHVFSEGVPATRGTRLKDNHNVRTMRRVYADERGRQRPPNHWITLLRQHPRLNAAYAVGRRYRRPDIQAQLHIATDTVQALHDMLAADFFVGSISGLSVQVVRYLARGVVFLPIPWSELGTDERTVPFDYHRNGVASFVNESLLYERVADYTRENRLACAVW